MIGAEEKERRYDLVWFGRGEKEKGDARKEEDKVVGEKKLKRERKKEAEKKMGRKKRKLH